MDDKKPKSSNGRIPKAKKVATGKKLAGGIRPLRSHGAGDLRAKVSRSKMTDAEQGAEFERLARDLGCDEDDEKFRGVLRKLAKSRN